MTHTKETVYVIHVCKNSKLKPKDPNYCDRAWVDVDKTNVKDTPPTWKYCEECVKKGFKNPRTRKSTMSEEQIEAFKKRMADYRKKQNESKII
jgi:hypothetical protein